MNNYIFIVILILILICVCMDIHRSNYKIKRKEISVINSAKKLLLQSNRTNPLGLFGADVLPNHEDVIEMGYTRTPKMGYTVDIYYNFNNDCFIFNISNGNYKTEFEIHRERFISSEFRDDLDGFLLNLESKFDTIIEDLDIE